MKSGNGTIIALILVIIVLGLILFLMSNNVIKVNNDVVVNSEKEEVTTILKTDIEISSIKERILMISSTLGAGNDLNTEDTYRKLINFELSKNSSYQIDENFDVIQKSLKVINKDGKTLHVTINTDNYINVSFNM